MKNIVLDTNCLLRMISRHSPYYPVWKAFLKGQYCLCVSNDIISEYREVISRVASPVVADGVVEAILNNPYCLRFDPHFHFNLIHQDPDDNKFVDCAIIANAEYIVTEDKHFDVLKQIDFPRVEIVTLDYFMSALNF